MEGVNLSDTSNLNMQVKFLLNDQLVSGANLRFFIETAMRTGNVLEGRCAPFCSHEPFFYLRIRKYKLFLRQHHHLEMSSYPAFTSSSKYQFKDQLASCWRFHSKSETHSDTRKDCFVYLMWRELYDEVR